MATEPTPPASTPHSIADFIHGYEEGERLRGFRSAACGFTTATWGLVCPRCGKADLAEVDLSGRGEVASFSIQHVPSDDYVNEAPYAYVVVELEEGGRMTGWMPTVKAESDLHLGDRVHWVASYKPGVQFAKDDPPSDTP
ncbi:MAG: OB-fold domain-containing protein [Thermoplasmata archaeon]